MELKYCRVCRLAICTAVIITAQGLCLVVPMRADDTSLARHVFRGIWHEREKLVTGECRITRKITTSESEPRVETFDLAFDLAASRWRFDADMRDFGETKYIENDGLAYFYSADSHSVEKNTPDAMLKHEFGIPWDPRLFGLDSTILFDVRTSYQDVKTAFETLPISVARKNQSGSYEIISEHKVEDSESDPFVTIAVYEIDAKRSVPVKLEARMRRENTGETRTSERTTTVWKELNGVVIPTKFETEFLDDNSRDSFELDWKSVNSPIDPIRFQMSDFHLPANVMIVDTRLNEHVILEITGQPKPPGTFWPLLAIGGGVIGVLLAGIALFRFRKRK